MGIAPSEFWKMTMWEYQAAITAYNKVNGSGEALASKEEAVAFYEQYGAALGKKK
jgi:hypothetical protein